VTAAIVSASHPDGWLQARIVSFVMIDRLQALRVVIVGLLAGGAADANGRSSVADSTALSVLLGKTTAAARGGGGGPRAGSGGGSPDSGGSGPGGAAGRRDSGRRARRPGGRGRRAAARAAATGLESTRVGRAEGTSLDVGVGDSRTGGLRLNICGFSGSDRASAASNTGLAWVGVGGVRGVQPVHVHFVVVPERHDKDHAVLESVTHSLQAASASEVVVVAEDALLVLAEGVGDRVAADTSDVGRGLLEDLATLDVQTADLDEVAILSVVGGDELSHNGNRLLGVDRLARAIERLVAHAEGVEVATVSVTVASVSAVTGAARSVGGAGAVAGVARVRSERVGDAVGLPDVHLVTARSSLASSSVAVVCGSAPALGVGFPFNELDVLGTLSITITCTVLGTGLVGRRNTTIGGHRHEVEGTVKTASELADVDVESELLVLQVEELVVLVLLVHEVDSGANIAARLELQAQGVARCFDAVSTRVVGAIESAVCRASDSIGAKGLVPGVAGVAVGRSGGGMEPAPVAVKDDALSLGCTSAGSALRDRERRVLLSSECAGLLSLDDRAQGEGGEGEGEGRHAGRFERGCSTAGLVGCGVKVSRESRRVLLIQSTDTSVLP